MPYILCLAKHHFTSSEKAGTITLLYKLSAKKSSVVVVPTFEITVKGVLYTFHMRVS